MEHEHDYSEEDMHNDIEHLKNEAWEAQEEAYRTVLRLENETPEAIFGEAALKASVAEDPEGIFCIDERAKPTNGKPRISIAGSGVLLDTEGMMKTIEKLRAANPKYATFHEGCGACVLYIQQYMEQHENSQPLDPMKIGREVALSLKDHLESIEEDAKLVGYSAESDIQMRGNPEFHDARAIVIDGTGRFNPDKLGFPESFLHSVRFHPDWSYTQQEVGVAISIANGDHGFGHERFLKDKIAVIIVGDPDDPEYSPEIIRQNLGGLLNLHDQYVVSLNLPLNQ